LTWAGKIFFGQGGHLDFSPWGKVCIKLGGGPFFGGGLSVKGRGNLFGGGLSQFFFAQGQCASRGHCGGLLPLLFWGPKFGVFRIGGWGNYTLGDRVHYFGGNKGVEQFFANNFGGN